MGSTHIVYMRAAYNMNCVSYPIPQSLDEYVKHMNFMLVISSLTAGLTEFQKRAHFISGSHDQHVLEPLMKRCLSEQPGARGTFEDVGKYLSVYQSEYGGKQAQKLEEQVVRHPHVH